MIGQKLKYDTPYICTPQYFSNQMYRKLNPTLILKTSTSALRTKIHVARTRYVGTPILDTRATVHLATVQILVRK